jgi:hypothetical protein
MGSKRGEGLGGAAHCTESLALNAKNRCLVKGTGFFEKQPLKNRAVCR